MPLKLLSLFSGIGAPEKALKNLGVDFDLIGFSEIDKYAIKSYCAIHHINPNKNLGNVTNIDEKKLSDFDLLVGGFPCQAFSIAGKRKGFEDTRGTLFFDLARIAKEKQPKIIFCENVKGLVNHDKGNTITVIIETLAQIGYTIDFNILNAKYFNVPQNRERIYIIAIRNDLIKSEPWIIPDNKMVSKRKKKLMDAGFTNSFNFPWPEQNSVNKRLKDILESEVDEKFYLNEKNVEWLLEHNKRHEERKTGFKWKPRTVEATPSTVRANASFAPTDNSIKVTKSNPLNPIVAADLHHYKNDQMNRVYLSESVGPSVLTHSGGGRDEKIAEPQSVTALTERRSDEAKKIRQEYRKKYGRDFSPRRSKVVTERADGITNCVTATQGIEQSLLEVRPVLTPERLNKRQEGRRFKENDEPAFTVNTQDRHGVAIGNYPNYRIRRLTPLECWRLMGFEDEDFKQAQKVCSNSQLYKQAGNSIVVNVLDRLFKILFNELKF